MRYDDDKYGATNGNRYAAWRCSNITRLTRNSLTWVRVHWGAAIFAHYKINMFFYVVLCWTRNFTLLLSISTIVLLSAYCTYSYMYSIGINCIRIQVQRFRSIRCWIIKLCHPIYTRDLGRPSGGGQREPPPNEIQSNAVQILL